MTRPNGRGVSSLGLVNDVLYLPGEGVVSVRSAGGRLTGHGHRLKAHFLSAQPASISRRWGGIPTVTGRVWRRGGGEVFTAAVSDVFVSGPLGGRPGNALDAPRDEGRSSRPGDCLLCGLYRGGGGGAGRD